MCGAGMKKKREREDRDEDIRMHKSKLYEVRSRREGEINANLGTTIVVGAGGEEEKKKKRWRA